MKQFLIELDDRCARDLERVAPAKDRRRAEFVRLAIRRAIDLALDRATAEAYRKSPVSNALATSDLLGWDERNALASESRPVVRRNKARIKRAS